MLEKDLTYLKKGVEQLNITLSDHQYHQFALYYDILIEWNKVMNLTGITEWDEVVVKHFIDSLAIVKACDMKQIKNVIDIGTGAGFPGIPLKIAFPDVECVLLDSLAKRIKFLDEVVLALNLSGIRNVHGRAEDYAKQKDYRESFGLCVSRAVAGLHILSEYCLPFVAEGGFFIPYKSGRIDEEVQVSGRAVKVLGGEITSRIKFQLADTDMERSFVVIKKIKQTPGKYPRKAGMPSKEPIL
ncbi:16S rRNA (guanine(527)-N(7))-methyltransferase RsmG [Lawsonibacter sp. OA9]|uniref:16S rRNA (guanine(527)-N(7))-methyltransferase RsmG n=1 Tax=Oscillospiraceae TaxID=216572 RepID=UPI001F060A85|nr:MULTISPECIES: 16S rRNA (guanine(527)-N(7))-methyltransferase RsmG [Oscillospiraceae]MCH1980960.1 16S rRNA (guanine(527)-N(7))-methyltransferase RsmG [Lawsonibacter sp. OA9]MCH1981569.1 16S rRNA (guanine(527)-N(7))-methyltransferase RsmG [Ruminococcus sp. OA3]